MSPYRHCTLELAGPKVEMRTIRISDLETIAEWFKKVDTFGLATGVDHPDLASPEVIAVLFDLHERLPNRLPLGIYSRATGRMWGFVDVWMHRPEQGVATIALFVVSPSAQRRGIGTEALQLVEEWWFGTRGGRRIRVGVASENGGGRKFFRGNGYAYYRTEKNALKIGGRLLDLEWHRKDVGEGSPGPGLSPGVPPLDPAGA